MKREKPEWVEQSASEIEKLVVKLAREGNSPSRIGVILRDQYGIPSVKLTARKSVVQILKARGLKPEIPEDLMNLLRKAVNLRGHLAKNPEDLVTCRSLETTESKIHKLAKYYVGKGTLPKGWRYDPERAAILVR